MSQPSLTLLSAADLELIHQSTLDVLARVGVVFRSDKAIDVLERAGCHVAHDTRQVRFPPELVSWALERVQREILLAGRNAQHDVVLDGSKTYASLAGICPHIVDADTGVYREPSLNDLADVVKTADALHAYDIVWYSLSPTCGLTPEMVDLRALACMLANTSKHIMGQVVTPHEVPFVLEMLALATDGALPAERPVFSAIYCPVAPLQHETEPLEAAMEMARRRVPLNIYSLALAGATGPASLAGTIMQTNCDVLSAVVLFQLVEPGCPLIYSANAGIMDMRTSLIAIATPETMLMNTAQIELAHWYGMPALSVGYVSDAMELGFRGGLEDVALAIQTHLSHPDIIVGMGAVGGAQGVSLVKMAIDAEVKELVNRLIQGIVVDGEHLGVETIAEVGPGGHYLARKETRAHVRDGEHWLPDLLSRSAESRQQGMSGEIQRARRAVSTILTTHTPETLPDGVDTAISELLEQAEVQIAKRSS
jgi:trimethylamine--corrinoid protein Co-methyltransferase